jgi:hypothetical protein
MCATDHCCTLLLDEVPIKQHVCFDQKIGCIEGLKILEVKTGQAVLQIALWCSWSKACLYSGSSQWFATLSVEAAGGLPH